MNFLKCNFYLKQREYKSVSSAQLQIVTSCITLDLLVQPMQRKALSDIEKTRFQCQELISANHSACLIKDRRVRKREERL